MRKTILLISAGLIFLMIAGNAAIGYADPLITVNSQDQAVSEGQIAAFTVTATGTTPLSYQWQKGLADLIDGGNISGVTTAQLTISNIAPADAGNYRCIVTNSVGGATSNEAVITVSTGTEYGASDDAGQTDDPLTDPISYSGDVYYIDSADGNDSNDGKSPATAWKTVEKVRSKTEVGYYDSIAPNDHSIPPYHEPWTSAPGNSAFLFKRGCHFDGYIRFHSSIFGLPNPPYFAIAENFTFGAYGDRAQPRPVIEYISPALDIPSRGAFWSNGHTFSLRNLHIIGSISNRGSVVSLGANSRGSSIVNCELENSNPDGICISGSLNFLLFNTIVHNTSLTDRGGGLTDSMGDHIRVINNSFINNGMSGMFAHNIYLSHSSYSLFEGNLLAGSEGGGITLHGLQSNVIIRRNKMLNNAVGLSITGGYSSHEEFDDITVEENIIIGSRSIGMYLDSLVDTRIINNILTLSKGAYALILQRGADALDADNSNVLIANNTFFNNSVRSEIGGANSKNISILSNIFYNDYLTIDSTLTDSELTLDCNLYYQPSKANSKIINYNGTDYSLSELKSASGKEQHGINADPLFMDETNNNFHLQSGSPAIDKGTQVPTSNDFAGNSRPQGGSYDIGAYEYVPSLDPAKTIFVDGNLAGYCTDYNPDANDGSGASGGGIYRAYHTIQGAANVSNPGDTVFIRGGTYTCVIMPNNNGNAEDGVVTITRSGIPGKPITFKAYQKPDGTYEEPILDGDRYHSAALAVHTPGYVDGTTVSYIIIDGLTLTKGASTGITLGRHSNSNPYSDQPVHHVTVRHCKIYNNTLPGGYRGGIYVIAHSHDIVVEYCESRDNGQGIEMGLSNTPGSATITPYNSIIRYNYFHDNINYPDNSDGIGPCGSAGIAIMHNVVGFNSDDGFDHNGPGSDNQLIEYNVFYKQNVHNLPGGNGNGVKIGQYGSTTSGSPGARNTIIRFNISMLNQSRGFEDTEGAENSYYYNNVAYKNSSYGWLMESEQINHGAKLKNNIGYQNALADPFDGIFGDAAMFYSTIAYSDYNFWSDLDNYSGFTANHYTSKPGTNPPVLPIVEPHTIAGNPRFVGFNGADVETIVDTNIYIDPIRHSINPDFGKIKTSSGQLSFTLRPDSTARDAGAFLTKTIGSGSGTQMHVQDAGYFFDGNGITDMNNNPISGDLIQLEGQSSSCARVLHVDRDSNTITLDTPIIWSDNQGVSLPYYGLAPDIGAYEYAPSQGEPIIGDITGNGGVPDNIVDVLDIQACVNIILGADTDPGHIQRARQASNSPTRDTDPVTVLNLQAIVNRILGV